MAAIAPATILQGEHVHLSVSSDSAHTTFLSV
jgi:hypothetical protein